MTNFDIQNIIYTEAINKGFTPSVAKFIVLQCMLETAAAPNYKGFESNVFKTDNNIGGHTLSVRLALLGYKKGLKRPSLEGGHYIHFNTVNDSIKFHINLLIKSYNVKNVDTLTQYVNNLKQNRYFIAPAPDYLMGLI